MDYHSIHGHDVSSFDTSQTHRLPTVSATQALDELAQGAAARIPSGVGNLDKALLGNGAAKAEEASSVGGFARGQVIEIWGPPGTGKTALGIQASCNALSAGDSVLWVDCFQTTSHQRIANVIDASRAADGHAGGELDKEARPSKFAHYQCLTLPHLMALLSRPTSKAIAEDVSLVVIDCLTALVNASLPRTHDEKGGRSQAGRGPPPSVKRRQALQSITNALQKLASTRNCAVLVLSQCATKMQSERGAMLVPAVNATVWEHGISSRIALFRDWSWEGGEPTSVHLAGLQKIDGRATHEVVDQISAFQITVDGVFSVEYDASHQFSHFANPTRQPKRKLGQTDIEEVPDSEDDEDYGWADDDESALPAPPPQWQGSEDILLGQEVGRSDNDDNDDNSERGENGDEEDQDQTKRQRPRPRRRCNDTPASSDAGEDSGGGVSTVAEECS